MNFSKIIYFLIFLAFGCAGSYNRDFESEEQTALIYRGAAGGNRILYFNTPKFPQLSISRKDLHDSLYVHVTKLKINPISLRFRVGYNGPGFAYDWKDSSDYSLSTRYKIVALDDSSSVIVELNCIYGLPDNNGGWKHIKE